MPRAASLLTWLAIASLGACSTSAAPPNGGIDSGTSSSSSGGYEPYDSGSEPLDADVPEPSCIAADGEGGGIGGCYGAGFAAYECPGDAAPPSSPSTTCAYFGDDPPYSLYCCTQGACTPSNISTMCESPGDSTWTCTGDASPDPSLTCSTLGSGMFCCQQAMCSYAGTSMSLQNCGVNGAVEVVCTGSAMPTQLDPDYACTSIGAGDYCCSGG